MVIEIDVVVVVCVSLQVSNQATETQVSVTIRVQDIEAVFVDLAAREVQRSRSIVDLIVDDVAEELVSNNLVFFDILLP